MPTQGNYEIVGMDETVDLVSHDESKVQMINPDRDMHDYKSIARKAERQLEVYVD